MKTILLCAFAALLFTSCEKETETITNTVMVDTSQPRGTFTVSKSGALVEQNSTGTAGVAQLGTDEDGVQFLKLSGGFTSNFATGTLVVYLSTSMDYVADPGNGNPDLKLIGNVNSGGDRYFKIAPASGSQFDHVILWCASASIPFGYAALN
ncbi:MAG: hypothetical protein SGI87_05650 [Flavobacteriales bacterium]|nr:hypothetical protein [Flavobacteriales bacterium]